MPLEGMKLADISDREVLLILNDLSDHEGWAEGRDIAERLAVQHPRANSLVGARLGWLYRYGALEREHIYDEHGNPRYTKAGKPRYSQRWRFTEVGRALAFGKFNRVQERFFTSLESDQLLLAARAVASHSIHSNETIAKLVSREWRHSTDPLRLAASSEKKRRSR